MNAYHDNNHTPGLIALKQTDGATIVAVTADATSHALSTTSGAGGTDYGPPTSTHDNSHVPVLMATSNADGVTPVAIYCDLDGFLLLDDI